jgi:ESS family glutamate:Na+ symporter
VSYWNFSFLMTLLWLSAILLGCGLIRRVFPGYAKLGLPDCMLAGVLGLVLGPQVVGVAPFEVADLEAIVYHGLALLFLFVGLQTPPPPSAVGGARSIAIGIPFTAVMQGIIGLVGVLVFVAVSGERLHPGFGFMLPLGFNQGPGQALSMGKAWQATGFTDGPQVGLIFAALGFAWSVFVGVPLVAYARRKGWITSHRPGGGGEGDGPAAEALPAAEDGALDPLTLHLGLVAVMYIVVFTVLKGITGALVAKPQMAAMLWGFHFLIAAGVSMGTRRLLLGVLPAVKLHDGLLSRLCGVSVDLTTAAALAAVQLAVLQAYWGRVLVITTVGGLLSLVFCVWVAKRAFPEEPFEHALVLFGTITGTLTTGMALLRIIDPELRGSTANNTVRGATGAVLLGAPLLLVIMPLPTTGFPTDFPGTTYLAIGLLAVYLVVLGLIWRFMGPLRFLSPVTSLWPEGSISAGKTAEPPRSEA